MESYLCLLVEGAILVSVDGCTAISGDVALVLSYSVIKSLL